MNPLDAEKVRAEINDQARHNPAGPPQPGVRVLAKIVSVAADTINVTVGAGGQESGEITVLKPTKVCPSLDQNVDGYTYSYGPGGTQTRTSTLGQDVEDQVVVPKFIPGDLVEIGPAVSNIGDYAASLAEIRLQIVNPPAYWSLKDPGAA